MTMTKIVAIMQPTYLPWIGYFELMDRSDVFVLLDDVQFVRKSWQQRNRIKDANGVLLLTVPVLSKEKRFQLICDVEIDAQQKWADKHLKSLRIAYAKAPFLRDYLPALEEIYKQTWTKLRELNFALIKFIKEAMEIQTPIALSSSMEYRSEKNERIVDICKHMGANVLYDTRGAEDVIDVDMIQSEGIRVVFQEYGHPVYRQAHGEFVAYLSAIDLLFNEGPASKAIMRSGGKEMCGLASDLSYGKTH